jgi:hypothetical protein
VALTIEDGTIVAGADSYATVADLTDYADKYGFTLPTTDAEKEALLRRAALQMNLMNWKGSRVESTQSLAWPRSDVYVDDTLVSETTIPARIEYGQMALACEIHADDESPSETAKGAVIREKVDVLEVQYAERTMSRKLLPAAPDRQSRAQFADYLKFRGWYIPALRA